MLYVGTRRNKSKSSPKNKQNLSSIFSNGDELHSEITVINEPDTSTEVLQTFIFSLLP